ncbi:hypothetical protein FisN_30Lh038 [Fistulifera solaris]|uniref:Uncharacterized protein n=1 Tax=Fistulifera solaris TaxID=1519565 RepID=A0A1Z5JIT0_FISSO|nr:hypothetical protein FisN_30Lh038 [Fistulifera solaris]|eukprot:GAX13752.1 hypothetical protein FisN_30Lh038 [Fistulifera solaris]
MASGRSPRFSMWVALTVFSVIVLGASVEVKNDQFWPDSEVKWAVACSSLTAVVGAVISAVHMSPVASSIIIGTPIEGVLALLLDIFWGCTVGVVNKSDDDQMFANAASVRNANLYYFSWACFVTATVLVVNYARHAYGLDMVAEVRNRGSRLSAWAALVATSLIVMGSSARILNSNCPMASDPSQSVATESKEAYFVSESYCPRTKFGVAVGCLGVFTACTIVACKLMLSVVPFSLEFRVSLVTCLVNAFGVAYITSNSGPGSYIGNLYYFTWMSFLLSVYLLIECFHEMRTAPADQTGTDGNDTQKDGGELPVEPLDDV